MNADENKMKLLQKDVQPAADKYTCASDGWFEHSHIQEWTDRDKWDAHFKSSQAALSRTFFSQN